MRLTWKISDINEKFYIETLYEVQAHFKKLIEPYKKINKDITFKVTPIKEYDPNREKEMHYDFPFEKHIKKVYNYSRTEGDMPGIEESISSIEEVYLKHPLFSDLNYKIDSNNFYNTHIGFLYYIATLKQKLLTGGDFSAKECAPLADVTSQAIVNRIRRGSPELKAKKISNKYVIPNSEVRRVVRESDSPIMKMTSSDNESTHKEAVMN